MSAEIRSISTTITANVSGGEGHLSAEQDNRIYGFNRGKTEFFEGDSCTFLVYVSKNISIVGSSVFGGNNVSFQIPKNNLPTPPSYEFLLSPHIFRQMISFNTPIASVDKPFESARTLFFEPSNAQRVGDPEFIKGTQYIRLNKWMPSLSPAEVPNYATMYIEYTPIGMRGVFQGLGIPAGLTDKSYPNTAIIYGVAQPIFGIEKSR